MVPLGFMDDHLAQNLWSIVRHYKGRLFIGLLLVFISNLLLLLNPLILRQALLIFSSHALEQEGLGSILHSFLGSYTYSLMAWVILLLSVASLSALLKYYMRIIFITIGREVEVSVREKMFQRIQSQSKGFFDRHGIGDLLSRLTNDISAYRDLLGPGLMYPVFFVTLIIPAVAVLFTLSPLMAWVSLIPIVVIYLFHFGIRSALYQLSHHVQELLGEMSVMVHEHFSGIRLIKSYGIEQATSKLFQKLCQRFSQMNLRLTCLQGFVFPVLSLVTRLVTVALVLLAGALILLHWQPLNLADFLAFMWIQSYMFGPLLMLGWVLPMYQRGQAAYHRLVEIYQEPLEVQDQPGALSAIPLNASIECRDLTFTYPKQTTPTLNHINLKIEGGSFIGLTGPVGAGKTTLLRLLNREYEIPRGKILIDGRDIHDYRLQAFHQAMITVDQLPFLFSQTIGNNISFGKPEATEEEIETVVKQANLYETIQSFPEQYETLVGERGMTLSGGQKQRIAVARAFLVNRPILLLDDIFSALDAATESHVFEAIKANFKGKTMLLVTHRISILEQLDQVIYMRDGEIIEEGSPQELMKKPGLYEALVKMYRRQQR